MTFTRHHDLTRVRMIESTNGVKRAAAALLGFDGAYSRFPGEIRVVHYRDGEIVDQHVTNDAIWELMYLGHARESRVEAFASLCAGPRRSRPIIFCRA